MKIKLFIAGLAMAALFMACASGPAPIGNATGTATGTARGWGGDVSVAITMANGFITGVEITGAGETPAFANTVFNRAPGLIKENNSPQFDAISGATVTSNAVREAAQMAVDMIVGQ